MRIAAATRLIDLRFQGHASYIATVLLESDAGPALIDPGPASTVARLREALAEVGLAVRDVRALLLTHIHLDHAGATGVLVRENPALRVFVHERGAPHLVDPSKLLASARRLYGQAMESLWGEFAAVPDANLTVLAGGERVEVAGRTLDVAYTPGHAAHHVSYLDTETGIAYVGDTAGIRVNGLPFALPPAPPPDIDLEAWTESLARIRAWAPARLFVTHFGPVDDVAAHLDVFERRLSAWAAAVRASLAEPGSDDEKARRFLGRAREEMRRHLPEAAVRAYETGGGIEATWYGLARYWRRRGDG
ncbi:MAG TPA: MBL fold metallo-hydrolase [Longimicrobiales bacterium]